MILMTTVYVTQSHDVKCQSVNFCLAESLRLIAVGYHISNSQISLALVFFKKASNAWQ